MKNLLRKLLFFTLFTSLISSCDLVNNNKDNNKPVDKFLTGYEMVKSYVPDFIKLAFDQYTNSYPDLEEIKSKVNDGILIYKITYNTSFNGEIKEASGLVCVPTGDGPFPIMSYQNGTNTLHSNAPSVNPDYTLYTLLEFVASTGFVVVIPDYLGFGASDDMFHPYLDKTSTVSTVLDMLRAAKELTTHYLDTPINDDLYIAGYSQGGWATMQLEKEIEEKYMDEFNLKASACGAGPYDLKYINQYVTGMQTYPMPYFLGYMFNSYINLGLTTPASDIFQEPFATKIPTLFDGTKSGEQINAELTTSMPDLFTADYIANSETDSKFAPVMTMLEENSISPWATEIPTLIIHGMSDTFVPKEVSTNMYQGFLAKGVPVNQVLWLGLPGLDHTDGIIPAGVASVKWFLDMKQ
ncbi:MAG TPA: alpha/beta fold hydrolase [Draconibacterium sp.]|nr:alpha/beta fold hydrolase [Draconibacterium sp.]